jgi:molybdate transport system substrate-binding protein
MAFTVGCTAARVALPQAAQTQSLGGNIVVFAAASLRDVFNEIGKDFEAANPGTKITFNFAGSQQLAEQIGFGAPADVFASANTRLMDAAVPTGRVNAGDVHTFARNQLIVIFPKSNPAQLQALPDLAKPGLRLVFANKTVPVGSYTLDFLNKASALPEFGPTYSQTVLANVVSYEEDERAVFTKVSLGEADAGVVYSSDVVADKTATVGKLDIPGGLNTIATYPIAPLKDSPNLALAQAFVRYVRSPEAQAVLVKYGFRVAGDH